MSHRLCVNCKKAENPLGRLKFKKHLDGKVYCEQCLPAGVGSLGTTPSVASQPLGRADLGTTKASPLPGTSAGSLVVIPCPTCHGRPVVLSCQTCSGYGSVRIPVNFLNVFTPGKAKAPQTLTEG